MKITTLNWDDIVRSSMKEIRERVESPSDYVIEWGVVGWGIFQQFVPKAKNGITYLGMKHRFNEEIEDYRIIKAI